MKARKVGWFEHPVISVMLGAAWLLLQESLALPQIITATILAVMLPRLLHGFLGQPLHPRAPLTMIRLAGVVVWDIIKSNLIVARIVLLPWVVPKPAWVPVPLDAQHPTAITLLATIITTTPGTVSCVVDDANHMIFVHALDCDDVPAMVADIKSRYERPLMEILG